MWIQRPNSPSIAVDIFLVVFLFSIFFSNFVFFSFLSCNCKQRYGNGLNVCIHICVYCKWKTTFVSYLFFKCIIYFSHHISSYPFYFSIIIFFLFVFVFYHFFPFFFFCFFFIFHFKLLHRWFCYAREKWYSQRKIVKIDKMSSNVEKEIATTITKTVKER